MVAAMTVSASPRRIRTAFCTPRTPACESASAISGADACRSSSSRTSVMRATVPGGFSAEEPGEPPILEHAASRLAGRAVVDRVLLVVHALDRGAARRAGLAEAVVDAVDVAIVLPPLPQLE